MENRPPLKKPIQTKKIVTIVCCVIIFWYFAYGRAMIANKEMDRITQPVSSRMQNIENKAANDAVDKYDIAARQGDKMQMYTQARRCASAFLEVKDEVNYDKWKAIQTDLGKELGFN